jgi:catechol 2,3-dioxygenase
MQNTDLFGLVDRLCCLAIGVSDLNRSLAFYAGVWGLQLVHRTSGTACLRAKGTQHHALVLHERSSPGFVDMTFGVRHAQALDALYEHVSHHGGRVESPPCDLTRLGGGRGFSLQDPEGRRFNFVANHEDHPQALQTEHIPAKLAHVVFNSVDSAGMSRFFTDVLGFRLSDQTGKLHFLRCNADHHCVAFANSDNISVNHIAFEMPSWNSLMHGLGRLRRAGHQVQWGLGRHGPGDNVFAYFLDPDGYAVEYTAEMQQIDELAHQVKYPDDWRRPKNLDAWGYADMPSSQISLAMHGELHPPVSPETQHVAMAS